MLSVYEGRVPLHQRLVLLCQDFLESIFDFNVSDILNLQKQAKHGTVYEDTRKNDDRTSRTAAEKD